jgi:hypothetical protein
MRTLREASGTAWDCQRPSGCWRWARCSCGLRPSSLSGVGGWCPAVCSNVASSSITRPGTLPFATSASDGGRRTSGKGLPEPYLEAEDITEALSYAAWRSEEIEVPLRQP